MGDLADQELRQRMLSEKFNFFGPTVAGYRLSAYRRLPIGWSPAPTDLFSDLYMWRKFLIRDDLTFGTGCSIRSAKFNAAPRRDMSLSERATEIADWARFFADPGAREEFIQCGFMIALRYLEGSRKKTIHQLMESHHALARAHAKLRMLEIRHQAVLDELEAYRKIG